MVEARFVGTRRPFHPDGLRVLGSEYLRELSENREGGDAQQRGEVAWTGVIANKPVGSGKCAHQIVQIGFVAGQHGHIPARVAESFGDFGKTFPWPGPHGASSADVNHDVATDSGRWGRKRQRHPKRCRQPSPGSRAMRGNRGRRRMR